MRTRAFKKKRGNWREMMNIMTKQIGLSKKRMISTQRTRRDMTDNPETWRATNCWVWLQGRRCIGSRSTRKRKQMLSEISADNSRSRNLMDTRNHAAITWRKRSTLENGRQRRSIWHKKLRKIQNNENGSSSKMRPSSLSLHQPRSLLKRFL